MKAVSWENLSAGLRETIERACTPAELEVMKIKVEHGDVVGDRSIACTTGRRLADETVWCLLLHGQPFDCGELDEVK